MIIGILTGIVLVGGYLFNALRVVRTNEIAVLSLFGVPLRVENPGLKFILWPAEHLVMYPTKVLQFEFPNFEVTTSAGEYRGHYCEKAIVTIERPTLYFQWPEDKALLQAIKNLPLPTETEKLKDIFEEIVVNTARSLYSRRTWQEINENPRSIYQEVIKELQDTSLNMANPFFRGGIKPLSVEIKGVKLPPELAGAINLPEVARFKAEETIIKAEAEAKRIAITGKGEAKARRALFEAIRQGDLPKEALFTLRDMTKGKGTTFALLPPEILQVFQGVLGPEAPNILSACLKDKNCRQELKNLMD